MGGHEEGSGLWSKSCLTSTPLLLDIGMLTTQCLVPSLPMACCWAVSLVPAPGAPWLSVWTKPTLNKFQYTLYKKARSVPVLTNRPPCRRKPLSGPSAQGDFRGQKRREGQLSSQVACHVHASSPRGRWGTPNRPGRCEEGVAGGAALPRNPLRHPCIRQPASPLSSCSLSGTVWGSGGERGSCRVAREGRTPLGLPPEKAHVTEGKAGAGAREAHDRRGQKTQAGGATLRHSAGG